jgi:small subunit ribosomal protein S1
MNSIPVTVKSMRELLTGEQFNLPKIGQILSGQIISVSKSSILIDLGSAGTGIVYPGEFYDSPDRIKALKSGDDANAMLLEVENDDGYRELSLKAAQMTTAWQRIKELKDSGQVIKTPIININKGGLIVEIEGVQGFLPLSQLSSEHYPKVEGGDTTKIVQVLQKFKGENLEVKILDFSEAENKLIVSERAIQEEAAKEELDKLSVGQLMEGTITEVTDFGAFVKLSDTLDGLIHSSEIDWKYVEDPREMLHQGDTVEAKIISLDGGRVSLSLKALKEDPWKTVEEKYKVGQKVKGKILKIRPNGAFVDLGDDIIGLIPTSEFGGQAPEEAVKIGEEYGLAVVNVDAKDHKLILTMEKLEEPKEEKES